jgi:hypothetical protein
MHNTAWAEYGRPAVLFTSWAVKIPPAPLVLA